MKKTGKDRKCKKCAGKTVAKSGHLCSGCGRDKPSAAYSSGQLKKKALRKCIACIKELEIIKAEADEEKRARVAKSKKAETRAAKKKAEESERRVEELMQEETLALAAEERQQKADEALRVRKKEEKAKEKAKSKATQETKAEMESLRKEHAALKKANKKAEQERQRKELAAADVERKRAMKEKAERERIKEETRNAANAAKAKQKLAAMNTKEAEARLNEAAEETAIANNAAFVFNFKAKQLDPRKAAEAQRAAENLATRLPLPSLQPTEDPIESQPAPRAVIPQDKAPAPSSPRALLIARKGKGNATKIEAVGSMLSEAAFQEQQREQHKEFEKEFEEDEDEDEDEDSGDDNEYADPADKVFASFHQKKSRISPRRAGASAGAFAALSGIGAGSSADKGNDGNTAASPGAGMLHTLPSPPAQPMNLPSPSPGPTFSFGGLTLTDTATAEEDNVPPPPPALSKSKGSGSGASIAATPVFAFGGLTTEMTASSAEPTAAPAPKLAAPSPSKAVAAPIFSFGGISNKAASTSLPVTTKPPDLPLLPPPSVLQPAAPAPAPAAAPAAAAAAPTVDAVSSSATQSSVRNHLQNYLYTAYLSNISDGGGGAAADVRQHAPTSAQSVASLFESANPDASGMLPANVASALLAKSGLNKVDLKAVWGAAKKVNAGTCPKHKMDLAEFLVAVKKAEALGGIFSGINSSAIAKAAMEDPLAQFAQEPSPARRRSPASADGGNAGASGSSEASPAVAAAAAAAAASNGIPESYALDPARLDVQFQEVLGSGSFATVRPGTYNWPIHGEEAVAIKIFAGTAGNQFDAKQEAKVIAELIASAQVNSNPHIVRMYGAARLPAQGLCLIMERVQGRSLRAVLSAADVTVSLDLKLKWLLQIAQGMLEMHAHKPCPVLHRDLKASNVLLDSDNVFEANAKISDFGVAKAIDTIVTDTYSRGAREWSAPEVFDGKVSFASDVYSFAVVIFEILSRQLPFQGMSGAEKDKVMVNQLKFAKFEYDEDMFEDFGVDEAAQKAKWAKRRKESLQKRRPNTVTLPIGDCGSAVVALMHDCWKDEPSERPQFAAIVDALSFLLTTTTTEN